MNKLILNSPAKLNLYLKVLNKRQDGYHNIETVFERISLSDKIILKTRPDKKIKIISRSKRIPHDKDNLCYRAAKLLQEEFSLPKGAEIKIIKRIPVGSGLGGGSSNAAMVLLGLNKLWGLGLKKERLANLAKAIGADVPFFIYQTRFAEGSSRGDKIKPLNILNKITLWHILAVPKITVSTAYIYKKWDELIRRAGLTPLDKVNIPGKTHYLTGLTLPQYSVKILHLGLRKKNISLLGRAMFNSLEGASLKLYPQIESLKNKLMSLGVKSILMSGSGPAVFGVVSSRKEAVSLCRQLKDKNRSCDFFVARTC